MKFVENISNFIDSKIKKFGAQYKTFSVICLVNHLAAITYEVNIHDNTYAIFLRIVGTLMCIAILFHEKWLEIIKKHLPLIWYTAIIINVTTISTLVLLNHNFSLVYLINFNIGVMVVLLLVDWLSFIFLQLFGILIAVIIFYGLGNRILNLPENSSLELFLYMLICTIIITSVLSRNKELHTNYIQQAKDELNEDLEQKVKERTVQLQKALDVKNEILNNISHEVRTPIQAITTISYNLNKMWDNFTNEERKKYVEINAKASTRLYNLMDKLINLSQISQQRNIINKSDFDLFFLCKEIANDLIEIVTQKNISIKLLFNSNTYINADRQKIEQALRIILDNSIKYSNRGYVELSATQVENNILITIDDEGIGIPKNELDLVFEPFYQSSRSNNKSGGSGIGLSLAKEIIVNHNGKIWAENKTIGTRVCIELPANYIPINNNPKKLKKIMVIDDEELSHLSLELMLRDTNTEVVYFFEGIKALEFLKNSDNKFDVILLDLMMPDIYGIELLKQIREIPKLSDIKIIIQTGSYDNNKIIECKNLNIQGYLKKPYTSSEVLDAINKASSI